MKDFVKKIRYIIHKSSEHKVGAYSASAAFFMFFSLVPLIMLILSLFRLIFTDSYDILSITNKFAPDVINEFLKNYLDEIVNTSKLSLTIVSAVALLWAASKGVFAMIEGLNSINEIKEERNYFVVRLTSVFYTITLVVILFAALIIMVFGTTISDFLNNKFPNIRGLVYVLTSMRFIIGFLFLVFFFAIVYKALPSGKIKFSEQFPGAVLASAGWVSFSILFSFFINNFSHYANIYGSLTAIIVLMLWMYICMYILFLGAEINLFLSKGYPGSTDDKDDKSGGGTEDKNEDIKVSIKEDKNEDIEKPL